jgi:hydroxyethylthiazole kinase-like uncharacterized protein yjeF
MHRMDQPGIDYLLDREGARRLDHAAITELGIPGLELMEQAAGACTSSALAMAPPDDVILILVGRGNNGGDGWAMARQLHAAGRRVDIRSLGPARVGSDASTNESRARGLGLPIGTSLEHASILRAGLVVDALFGTGLDRPIEGTAADWIDLANGTPGVPTLSVDIPSGLDSDTGTPLGPVIRAERTVTFVAPKLGMGHHGAASHCGTIEVVGIGTPDSLLEQFGIRASN